MLFYDTKIRPVVDKHMKESGLTPSGPKYHSCRFSFLHRLKKEMWAKESEEVRNLVEEERKKLEKEGESGSKVVSNDLEELKRLEMYVIFYNLLSTSSAYLGT